MRFVQAYVSGATRGLTYENQRKEINKVGPCDEEYMSEAFRIAAALLYTNIHTLIYLIYDVKFGTPNRSNVDDVICVFFMTSNGISILIH